MFDEEIAFAETFLLPEILRLKVKVVNHPNKRKDLSLVSSGKCGRIGLCKYRNSFLIKGAYLISG